VSERIDRRRVTVVAATGIEAAAARKALPGVRVYEAGIALWKLPRGALEDAELVISCGIAGGLRDTYPSGTVLIPKQVRRPDGGEMRCDPELFEVLTLAARRLGCIPVDEPLVTTSTIVHGTQRRHWADLGYVGVDMETGLLPAGAAAVRVILDTPQQELSADWSSPARALRNPRNWSQALWLARAAPRYARLAAAIVAAACS
jgi:hypothetical protein